MSILSADDITQAEHYTKQTLVKRWLILMLQPYMREAMRKKGNPIKAAPFYEVASQFLIDFPRCAQFNLFSSDCYSAAASGELTKGRLKNFKLYVEEQEVTRQKKAHLMPKSYQMANF